MIKINSLLPHRSLQKEAYVQTDGLLPKISFYNKNRKVYDRPIKHFGMNGQAQINKNSQSALYYVQSRQKSLGNQLNSQNTGVKLGKDKKQNSHLNLEPAKIEAKQFKFLKFQQNILKMAILKHLEGKQLCKDEKKKIEQIIKLSFVSIQEYQSSYLEQSNSSEQVIVQIPIQQVFSFSIKQIVDKVREIYLKQNPRREKVLARNLINKKIAQLSQSFVYQAITNKIYEPQIIGWKRQQIVMNYLQKYVKQCENKLGSSQDLKLRLITFYQNIYEKYQSVPFNAQENMQITPAFISPKTPKEDNFFSSKSCKTSGSPFLKLKFCNDLRKQIKKLGEDTQKIIVNEMNKLGEE